jgi:predicted nucleotidyltransferase
MLNKNFRDMLFALNDAGVEYLVVGAYALAAHGSPRATGDIDFWVRAVPDNATRVWRALSAFGAPMSRISVEDFVSQDVVFQIGLPPQRIDILTSISGVEFEDAWNSRIDVEIDGISVPVLGLNELLINKSSSGRDKDAADVQTIRRLLGQ